MNSMTKLAAPLLVGCLMALPVQASGFSCDSGPKAEWKSKDEVTKNLTAQGYDVRKVEVEDGCYEAYVMKDGQKLEVFVNPKTGTIEKTKKK